MNHKKKSLVELIKNFSKSDKGTTDKQTLQYNLELDQAMERVGKGEFTTMEELRKEMESW